MKLTEHKKIFLYFKMVGESRLFALVSRSQYGLLGVNLLFPAPLKGGKIINESSTCAEGGRFYKYRIILQIRSLTEEEAQKDYNYIIDIKWLSYDQIKESICQSLCTSLELRLVWSLVENRTRSNVKDLLTQ
jgi:hypothetical protein